MTDYCVRRGTSRWKTPISNRARDLLHYRCQEDDGKQIECGTESWPDKIPCPDCGKEFIAWAEDGYVPGHRICHFCGSHWSLESPRIPGGQWFLQRARFYG